MAELEYELRLYKGLVSAHHDDDQAGPCPEVFRGRDGAWIACDHPSHNLDAEGRPMELRDRRRRLLREVIPVRAEQYKDAEKVLTQTGGVSGSAVRSSKPASSRPKKGEPRPCACGCEEMTKGGKFIPGHDAKLKSRLLKIVTDTDSRPDARFGAYAELMGHGWESVVKPDVLAQLRALGLPENPRAEAETAPALTDPLGEAPE